MSKGLESFIKLKALLMISTKEGKLTSVLDLLNDVEKELKEYEEMKTIKGTTTFDKAIEDTLINACPNAAKKLKALEIIKKKRVNIKPLKRCINLGDSYIAYNKMIKQECWDYDDRQLTQEEYVLLKEVLL